MGDIVRGTDFNCRYIRELPGGTSSFTRFLQQLGVKLPHGITVADAVKFGWVEPVLRIKIPHAYFAEWEEYPLIDRRKPIDPQLRWADWVWRGEFAFHLMFPEKGRLKGDWFLHPFDTIDSLVAEVRAHAIDPLVIPQPFSHRAGFQIASHVDFYPYWQAYRLMESLDAAQLVQPLLNIPNGVVAAEAVLREFERLVQLSNSRLAALQREYAAARRAFEWISLYRTALAAEVQARGKKPNLTHAAKRILARIDRDPEQLQDEIRDVLLTRWSDWSAFGENLPDGARRHLQQDIKRAVDFIEAVTGSIVDHRNDRWYFADRMRRRWAQLHEALPFEHCLAREAFPRRAAMYLRLPRRLTNLVPSTEPELRVAMTRQWDTSYAFRRFIISFHRLHELLDRDARTLVTFREHNVIDYMVLGCLIVERMITERWRRANPSAAKLPKFDTMIVGVSRELTSLLKCKPLDSAFVKYTGNTYLYTLKVGDRLPLMTPKPRSGRHFVFWAFHNLRILRNYAAHHDVLDLELTRGRAGGHAMRVIVGCVALLLALPK